MNKKIRCALLGLGNQGCEHLAASVGHPEVEIVAAVDSQLKREHDIREQFPLLDLKFFSSFNELVHSDLKIDALILALPHHAYAPMWQKILDWKKPMLKEKPLGRNYQEAKMFMATAKAVRSGLRTAIQRRNHASYRFLFDYLKQHNMIVTELHAHLHLGKAKNNISNISKTVTWRDSRDLSGGGALLDAGYHLIDLVQFLIGDFDVISSTMWHGIKADNGLDIEDRCWLTGRSTSTWIMLDTWVQGEANDQGGFIKSEQILLKTSQGILRANREGVWLNETQLVVTDKDWSNAMRKQLTDFARNIQFFEWSDDIIIDQLAAMRKIEEAYRLSAGY